MPPSTVKVGALVVTINPEDCGDESPDEQNFFGAQIKTVLTDGEVTVVSLEDSGLEVNVSINRLYSSWADGSKVAAILLNVSLNSKIIVFFVC